MRHDFDYSQITKEIYMGTNMCCATHFPQSLLKKRVFADISLEEKHVDAPFGVSYYLWLPVEDLHCPTLEQLYQGSLFLAHLVQARTKVYVHCKNGHGRSATLVIAYFLLQGMQLDQAIYTVYKKRKTMHLSPAQLAGLHDFEKYVQNKIRKE